MQLAPAILVGLYWVRGNAHGVFAGLAAGSLIWFVTLMVPLLARANVIEALNTVDWGNKYMSVRINGLDTPYWYRDVVELLEEGSERIDQIMIPKVGCAADLYAVDALVTSIESAKGRTKPIAFEVIIETAAGIAHVEEIAASSPRLQAMSLGAADFAASMGMQTTGIGGTQENYYMLREGQKYWSDPWHWAQTAIVAACRTCSEP